MKKLTIKLAIVLGLITLMNSGLVLAKINTNDLMPDEIEILFNKEDTNYEIGETQIKATQSLVDVSAEQIIGSVILQILEWTFVLTVIAIVVAAIYYVTARGNDEDITKAKNILLYLVIGMAIIGAAYGVIAGITQLEFLKSD
jgi:hypothetical protein